MSFIKYQHIERLGRDEVEDIEIGECYIFPKLDGTNSSLWYNDGLRAGSRNRELSLDKDNAGFLNWALNNAHLINITKNYPSYIFYGEWLVPHTLKTYDETSWKNFWIFDVWDREKERYLSFEEYSPLIENTTHIPPIYIIKNPTEEQLYNALKVNTFLIKDGAGAGEGIVIKNYSYQNKYGNQKWAKLVRNDFKEENKKIFGIPTLNGKKQIEAEIVDTYITLSLVQKTQAKIELETKDRKTVIPRLLQTVFHELVTEELWDALKKYKNPTIDFKKLNQFCILKIKGLAKDLF